MSDSRNTEPPQGFRRRGYGGDSLLNPGVAKRGLGLGHV